MSEKLAGVPPEFDPGPVPFAFDRDFQIPIHLMGGTHRCTRCSWSWQPDTWACREPWTANSSICRYCATADPALRIWQRYCDIADQLDQIMQAAADPELRSIITEMLSRDVHHFAQWRGGPEEVND